MEIDTVGTSSIFVTSDSTLTDLTPLEGGDRTEGLAQGATGLSNCFSNS